MLDPRPLPPDLPPEFIEKNRDDPAWLAALPGRLEEFAARWSIALGPHFPGIRFNYVAPATRADGTVCVFKISRHLLDTRAEIAALRLWGGHMAARLLEAEPEAGALLIERLEPGTMLSELAATDDDAATFITAGLLRRLWRRPEESGDLITLERWCAAFDRNREALIAGADGFPADLFRRADDLRRDLLASTDDPVLLHGDMHHFNVLRARREPWLAIDPKGLVGDRSFDVCMFLRNPITERIPPAVNRRRLDIFCAELGLDRPRTVAWCFVHAVLDACWDYEDGNPWRDAVAWAEETLTL